jgi:hypothetical protein
MANITAQMVKELREMTGAGMMDCKSALNETNGDIEAAVDLLRKKGLSKAAKKAGRVAAEGLVGRSTEGTKAAVVEVNSETDFVARNDHFQGLVKLIAHVALKTGERCRARLAAPATAGGTVADAIATPSPRSAENMTLRRAAVRRSPPASSAPTSTMPIADGPRQDRRARRAWSRPATRPSSRPSAAWSRCMSPRPTRSRSTSLGRSGRCSPARRRFSPRRTPASPRT